jgi:hypothetical protein
MTQTTIYRYGQNPKPNHLRSVVHDQPTVSLCCLYTRKASKNITKVCPSGHHATRAYDHPVHTAGALSFITASIGFAPKHVTENISHDSPMMLCCCHISCKPCWTGGLSCQAVTFLRCCASEPTQVVFSGIQCRAVVCAEHKHTHTHTQLPGALRR